MKICAALSFLLAFASSVALTLPFPADAWWTRHSASDCLFSVNERGDQFIQPNEYFHGVTNFGSGTTSVWCALTDTSSMPKGNIEDLNVHVWDSTSSDSVEGKTCFDNWDFSGGSCTSPYSSGDSNTGNRTLAMGSRTVTLFNGSGVGSDFGYIVVVLPPSSEFRGFYTHD